MTETTNTNTPTAGNTTSTPVTTQDIATTAIQDTKDAQDNTGGYGLSEMTTVTPDGKTESKE